MNAHTGAAEWVTGGAGTAAGAVLAAVLRQRSYRRDSERHIRRLPGLWLLPVLLGLTWAAVVWRFGATQPAVVPAYLTFCAAGAGLSWVDLDVQRLPDRVLWPCTALTAAALAAAAAGSGRWDSLQRAALAAAALGASYLAVALLATLGLGDVKLAVLVGLVTGWAGWPVVYAATMTACTVFTLAWAGREVTRRGRLRTVGAFGPAMVTGAVLALLAH